MSFTSKLSPEQWAEARRMRADGASYARIGRHFGLTPASILKCAQREGWSAPAGVAARRTTRARRGPGSPGTAGIRGAAAW